MILAEPGTVLIDPASFNADGTVSLGDFKLSPDGSLVAYGLSDGGSDWKTWRVRNTASGRDTDDVLVGTKFTPVSWSRDGMGFYYSRYPADAAGGYDDSKQVAVYYHLLGTAQADDQQIYAITDHPTPRSLCRADRLTAAFSSSASKTATRPTASITSA